MIIIQKNENDWITGLANVYPLPIHGNKFKHSYFKCDQRGTTL